MGVSVRLATASAARTCGRLAAMLASGVKGKSGWMMAGVIVVA